MNPSLPCWPKHDVFLNYSFQDIGNGFVSHLKRALEREGFTIFDHTKGEDIRSAIQESGLYVPIFSTGYASSVTCLDELLDIMDCLERFNKRKAFPLFFNIEPSDVRKQLGSFTEAFESHQTTVDPHKIQKWKQALKKVGEMSGECLQNTRDEEKFVRIILKHLRRMQNPEQMFLHVTCPVGVDSRVVDIISALRLNDRVFNIVAVLGISGSGKTTIVKAVYDRIAADFEHSCFIEDVSSYKYKGQRWKFKLQKDVISGLTRNAKSATIGTHTDGAAKIMKLITRRKVLMVLDGVDKSDCLEALGIRHTSSFGCLSRIIVTTTNKESFDRLPFTPYDMRFLDTTESTELFVGLTFRKYNHVNQEFVKQVVRCAGGLPLVLDVWSRHFRCDEMEHWQSILEKLKRIPHKDIQSKLQVSYDSLDNIAKKLFLDIACFFKDMKKDLVVKALLERDSGFFPEIEIQRLVNKALVKIDEYNCLHMHQAIEEMGIEVVRKENEDEPGQRTRLLDRDVGRVMEDCSGTEVVESITWRPSRDEVIHVQVEALMKMRNLRLIRLDDYSSICWSFSQPDDGSTRFFSFKKLRYVSWSCFPFKSLDTIDMPNVVVLELPCSKLEILWEGIKNLKKLKVIDMSNSRSLTRTGTFTGLENLEELRLNNCDQLEELHDSISHLDKLRNIMLRECVKLESILNLPPSIEDIQASGCTSLVNLPSNMCKLRCLKYLNMDGCVKIESIPNLPLLIEKIEARHCTSLVNLPSNITKLQHLEWLHLDGCFKLEPQSLEKVSHIPREIGKLASLKALDISENTISSVPDSFSNLSQLKVLRMNRCFKLETISNLPPSIEEIEATDCTSLTNLSSNMSKLQCIKWIVLDRCVNLQSIPNLPSIIEKIEARDCTSLVNLPSNISELQHLEWLHLDGCFNLEPQSLEKVLGLSKLYSYGMRNCNVSHISREIRKLVSLKALNISENSFSSIPDSFTNLSQLKVLRINRCAKIETVSNLPPSIEEIEATDCTSLTNLPSNMSKLQCIRWIVLDRCVKLESIPNLPPIIEKIEARDCTSLVNLPSNISELQHLQWLHLDGCFKLEPQSMEKVSGLSKLYSYRMRNCNVSCISCEIGKLVSLKALDISENSFSFLPHSFNNLSQLKVLRINRCAKIETISNLPPSIEKIEAIDCTSLANLPSNMSKLQCIRWIVLDKCTKLESIPNLPSIIEKIEARDCSSLVNLPSNISELQHLEWLHLDGCFNLEPQSLEKVSGLSKLYSYGMRNCNVSHISREIGKLVSIKVLDISENTFSSLPDSFGNLLQLKVLRINRCAELETISNFPPHIEEIEATDCTSLVYLPSNMSKLQCLRWIVLDRCVKLQSIPKLPPIIEKIEARDCTSLVNLPSNISELQHLEWLHLDGCFNLEPQSLEKV